MKRYFLIPAVCFAVLSNFSASAEEVRVWTSNDGRKLSAKLVGLYPEGAKLEIAGRKVVELPFDRLSPEDVAYAKKVGVTMVPKWGGWPNELRMNLDEVRISVDEERSKDGLTYYLTEHFELKSEVGLGSQVMLDVGRIFKLTYRLIQASPWGILASPEGGRFKAELYGTREAYIKAGAPPWSGGVYMGSRKVFMVPVESLGLKMGSNGYRRDDSFSLDTVVHEITHMLMGDAIPCLPIAITEGIAEYMSKIPLRTGAFRPGSILEMVRKEADELRPTDFRDLLEMTAEEWSGAARSPRGPGVTFVPFMPVNPRDLSAQYHGSLLIVYHLMHGLDNGQPKRLQKVIALAHARAVRREELITKYNEDLSIYKGHLEKFLTLPGVTPTDDGGFTYPSNLTLPEPPELPVIADTAEAIELADIEVLFDGKSIDEFEEEMKAKLKEARISL